MEKKIRIVNFVLVILCTLILAGGGMVLSDSLTYAQQADALKLARIDGKPLEIGNGDMESQDVVSFSAIMDREPANLLTLLLQERGGDYTPSEDRRYLFRTIDKDHIIADPDRQQSVLMVDPDNEVYLLLNHGDGYTPSGKSFAPAHFDSLPKLVSFKARVIEASELYSKSTAQAAVGLILVVLSGIMLLLSALNWMTNGRLFFAIYQRYQGADDTQDPEPPEPGGTIVEPTS